MVTTKLPVFLPMAAALLGAAILSHWLLSQHRTILITPRVPLADNAVSGTGETVDLKGFFRAGDGSAGKLGGDWPCFRGASRDNIGTEPLQLARKWTGNAPPRLWQVETGEGYAGATVFKSRVYLLDYDDNAKADVLRCLSADDGREIWRRGYRIDIGRNHGISRTVCAAADGCVVSIGPKCQVLCANAITGDFQWGVDLPRDFHATVPPWYTGQNPLIDNGRVILAPGGDALLVALDLASGRIVWKSANPRAWEMTHSSIVPLTFQGRRLYVYCASGGVVGVSADDGSILFELPQWKVSMANVPSPLPLPGDRILLTGGYGAGSMMIQLAGEGGVIVPKVLYRLPPEVFGAEQQTPVFYQGYVYGVIPVSGELVCLSLDGKPLWTSGAEYRFGAGPFLIADGMILLLNDTGTLTLAEASPAAFKPVVHAKLFEHGHESWGPMALAGGRLFARDLTRLACFDLREATHE